MSGSFRGRLAAVLIGELVNKAAVVVAFVWLARTLPPAAYGQVEWALSLLMVSAVASDAGLTTWGAATVAARPKEAGQLLARIGCLRLALAAPAYGVLLLVARTYGGPAAPTLAIYGLTLFLAPFSLQYAFNGLLRSGWTAVGQSIRGSVFLAAVLVLVRPGALPSTAAVAELIAAAALAVTNVAVLRHVFRLRIGLGGARLRLAEILTQSWPIGASELTWGVHWYAGLILLGFLAAPSDVAWHSASLRLVMALHTGVYLYLYVLLPNLTRSLDGYRREWRPLFDRSLRLTGWIGCAAALTGTLAARPILTTVFGQPFAAAVPAFRLMIWIVPLAWTSGHIRYSLVAAGHARRDSLAAIAGAITTIVLTAVLAPTWLSAGSAFALLAGTAVNALTALALARTVLPEFALLRAVAASSVACLGCLLVGAILTPVVGEAASAFGAAAALAATALLTERDDIRFLLRTWNRLHADTRPRPTGIGSGGDPAGL